jgi:hypothetical protein
LEAEIEIYTVKSKKNLHCKFYCKFTVNSVNLH